ncbi:small ribosomal subunit protein mS47 [Monosporozyma servazzii]
MWRSSVKKLPNYKASLLQPLKRQAGLSTTTINSNMNAANEPAVLYQVKDTARLVVLNRPEKLNALNSPMCKSMFDTLNEYSKSDLINLIIIKSSNAPRSLCAGGDVATVAKSNLAGNFKESTDVFTAEYSLNYLLATFNKPIVSFMDGITMGGGVGVSIHSPFRVASEFTKWAMPEMDIGFFPDVGTTFALPRILTLANSNSQMALYICLTGDVFSGEDAYILGLASHYVSHDNMARLETRLGEINSFHRDSRYSENQGGALYDMINDSIEEYSEPRFPSDYKFKFSDDQLAVIEKCFNIDNITSIEDILHNLKTFDNGSVEAKKFATQVEEKLRTKSLTSMDVAIKSIQENSKDHIESALRRDLYVAGNMCYDQSGISEFSNAAKFKLVDKGKTPYSWKHTTPLNKSELNSLFSTKPSIPLSLWSNNINVTWKHYPHHLKYQLPTERIIEAYINRTLKDSKNLEQDTINYFLNYKESTKDKLGVKLLCHNVLRRKFQNPANQKLE